MRRAAEEQALFGLLGVDENASWEEVRQAFRTAVRASHPDLHGGDADAERRLKALNLAWESINTPGRWAAYVMQPGSDGRLGVVPPTRDGAAVPRVARLRVQRQLRGAAGMSNWKLELDGQVVADLENGGVSLLDASPGRHSLRVFYGSRSSVPVGIDLFGGQELRLGCRQLENLRTSLFSPKRSLVIELLGSRSFVGG